MIRKDKHKLKSGTKVQVRVVEGYKTSDGKIKQKTIKDFGYEPEDQNKKNEFWKEVENFDKQYFKDKKQQRKKFFHEVDNNVAHNYGYKLLQKIYHKLEIPKFFKTLKFNGDYDLSEVFEYYVIQRILLPASKLQTIKNVNDLYNFKPNFQLHDVYRALSQFDKCKFKLQHWISDKVKQLYGNNREFVFYDVTNFYTEIDYPSNDKDLRQRGVSKEHRVDPIVQMGLFMDSDGIPLGHQVFKGNIADSKTLISSFNELKQNETKKVIVVADKGINSGNNITFLNNNGCGFVFSQTIKGKKGRNLQDKLFDNKQWVCDNVASTNFKYKEYNETMNFKDNDGNTSQFKVKVLLSWSKKRALRDQIKRLEKINKAIKAIDNKTLDIVQSYKEYVSEIAYDNKTGEVIKKQWILNETKIREDEKYDGYSCIITSELNMPVEKIFNAYKCLSDIENCFKITKSELQTRPIYVTTEQHIQGHFLLCYVALVLIKVLQHTLSNNNVKLSVSRIVSALATCKCTSDLTFNKITVLANCKPTNKANEYQPNMLDDYLVILKALKIKIPKYEYAIKEFEEYLTKINI